MGEAIERSLAAAFKRGQEEMRERAVSLLEVDGGSDAKEFAAAIRALPVSEEKP